MFAYFQIIAGVCAFNPVFGDHVDVTAARAQVDQVFCDLSFGQRQVEQVICDRPDMGPIINRHSVLRMMLIWHFAGEINGRRVYWDCREPTGSGQPADHISSFPTYPTLIRVSNKRRISGVDKCTMLLFELLNSDVDEEYQLLASTPVEERKSRDEFAISCVRREFEASQKTRRFFLAHPIANATFKNDPDYYLTINSSGDFREYLRWLETRDSKDYDPRKYYRGVYDGLLPAKKD